MIRLRKLLAAAVVPGSKDGRIAGTGAGAGFSRSIRGFLVMKDKMSYRQCLQQLKELGLQPEKAVRTLNTVVCRFRSKSSMNSLKAHNMVKRVEPDRSMRLHILSGSTKPLTSAFVCPPGMGKQLIPWGVTRIQAPKVWHQAQGTSIRVAVLDTGISPTHPDLHVLKVSHFISTGVFVDLNGHGTHVAGIIAALNNRIGVVGVAPKVELYAIQTFDWNGKAYASDIAQGLDWCIRNRMDVINMSFGMAKDSRTVKELIRKAYRRGIVLVASAGNSGTASGQLDFPGRLREVIAVAASTQDNEIAGFSSRGKGLTVSAPGQNICSTYPGGTYRVLSGTSMAAPHVTGAAALLLAYSRRLRSGSRRKLTPRRVKLLLQAAAVRLPGFGRSAQGAGLLRLGSMPAGLRLARRR